LEFILNKQNRLRGIGALINDDCFLATISLAPGGGDGGQDHRRAG
jgi:hypothetical protein